MVRRVFSHAKTLPLLDEAIFKQQEGENHMGLA